MNDMSFMFSNCSSLKQIEFISFENNQATNMTGMFQECKELEYLDLSNFNTSNVTNMMQMFKKCVKLKEIKGINDLNIDKIKNMEEMFKGCHNLENLDKIKFNLKLEDENIIAVNFTSTDYSVNFPVPGNKKDNFSKLEDKLYKEYPDLKNKEHYYICNGSKINTAETLERNNIKSGSMIVIVEVDNT